MSTAPDAHEEQVMEYRITAKRGGRGTWFIAFHEDRIDLSEKRGRVCAEIYREDRGRDAVLKEIPFRKTVLVVRIPDKATFELGEAAAAAYREWRGPLGVTDLKVELRPLPYWAAPIGLLFILGSLPFPADEAAGVPATDLQPTSLALGATLLGLAVLSRAWQDPRIFLLETFWFVALAADTILAVIRGGHPLWLLLLVPIAMVGLWSLRSFRRFRGVRGSGGSEAAG